MLPLVSKHQEQLSMDSELFRYTPACVLQRLVPPYLKQVHRVVLEQSQTLHSPLKIVTNRQ